MPPKARQRGSACAAQCLESGQPSDAKAQTLCMQAYVSSHLSDPGVPWYSHSIMGKMRSSLIPRRDILGPHTQDPRDNAHGPRAFTCLSVIVSPPTDLSFASLRQLFPHALRVCYHSLIQLHRPLPPACATLDRRQISCGMITGDPVPDMRRTSTVAGNLPVQPLARAPPGTLHLHS